MRRRGEAPPRANGRHAGRAFSSRRVERAPRSLEEPLGLSIVKHPVPPIRGGETPEDMHPFDRALIEVENSQQPGTA
jgi:hypothetical protein